MHIVLVSDEKVGSISRLAKNPTNGSTAPTTIDPIETPKSTGVNLLESTPRSIGEKYAAILVAASKLQISFGVCRGQS